MYGDKYDREVISKLLNDLLIKEDVTKKHFAEIIGISASNMYRYLRGETYPNNDDYNKIQDYLGLPFNEFWDMTHDNLIRWRK